MEYEQLMLRQEQGREIYCWIAISTIKPSYYTWSREAMLRRMDNVVKEVVLFQSSFRSIVVTPFPANQNYQWHSLLNELFHLAP